MADDMLSAEGMARVLSRLPIRQEQLLEVYDAVNSSTGNGYDEEYMMADLISCPGAGVGSKGVSTKSGSYDSPLRDLISDYFAEVAATKAGAADAQAYLDALSDSDLQIYWPYSEDWDGASYPIITFDPGYGAESNYGYELRYDENGYKIVDSVLVNESVAMSRPVWVINRNDDSAFTPADMFIEPEEYSLNSSGNRKTLFMKDFTMLRNYDSWFCGASEFFIKVGAAGGFKITDEDDMRNYTPGITDLMVVVRRKYLNVAVPFEAILVTDFTDEIDKIAFLLTEDDGGTTTSWKCEATVKWKSKTWGFELDIPYKDKDDIVWRGQLSGDWFREEEGDICGRFGDVKITFALR